MHVTIYNLFLTVTFKNKRKYLEYSIFKYILLQCKIHLKKQQLFDGIKRYKGNVANIDELIFFLNITIQRLFKQKEKTAQCT